MTVMPRNGVPSWDGLTRCQGWMMMLCNDGG